MPSAGPVYSQPGTEAPTLWVKQLISNLRSQYQSFASLLLLASLHVFCCVTWFPLASLCLYKKQGPEGYHSSTYCGCFLFCSYWLLMKAVVSLLLILCLLWIHMMQFPLPFPCCSVFWVSSFLYSRLCYQGKKIILSTLGKLNNKTSLPIAFPPFCHSFCSIPVLPVFPQSLSLFYILLISLFLALFFVSWHFLEYLC